MSDVDSTPSTVRRFQLLGPRAGLVWATTTLLLLMVTKGPVYVVRLQAAPMSRDFLDDVWIQAAFVSMDAIVIALTWGSARRLLRQRRVVATYGVLVALLLASSAWSIWPARSFQQGLMLALDTTAALLVGVAISPLAFLTALWTAMQIGVVASVWADARSWGLARDHNDDLAGIYFNRNSLGPVAILGLATTVVLVALVVERGGRRRAPVLVGLGTVAAVNAVVWWESGSLTPLFGAAVAVTGVGLLQLCRPGARQRARRRLVGVSVLVLTLVAGLTLTIGRSIVTDRLGRSVTFSGRTTIWHVVLSFAADRPLVGWGFMGIWRGPAILDELSRHDRLVYFAHSGYLEVLVGAGIVGLLSLVALVVLALLETGKALWSWPSVLTAFGVGLVLYVVAVNLGETYVGANLLPWFLLATATAQAASNARDRDRAVQPFT